MTKTLWKTIRRSVSGTFGRFAAILLIIMLGVAFLTGLRLTRPVMIRTAAEFIDETRFFDLRLLSTIGFDEDDVKAVAALENVAASEGSYTADLVWIRNDTETVLQASSIGKSVNVPMLTEGRMPESSGECLLDASRFSADAIGTQVTVDDWGSAEDSPFAHDTYTVTGLALSSLYMSVERGTSSLGDGSLDGYMLIPPEGFDSEYFTQLYVKAGGNFELYSAPYEDFIERLSETAEAEVAETVNARMKSLVAEAEEEIADGERELGEQRADAEQELRDAKQALEDALAEIEDGERQLSDAREELAGAKKTLDDGAAQLKKGASWQGALDAGWAQYYDGKKQLDSALAQGEKTLSDSKKQLDEGETAYNAGKAQIDEGKAALEAGKLTLEENAAAVAAGRRQWQAGMAELEAGEAQYSAGLSQWQAGASALDAAQAELEAAKDLMDETEYEARRAEIAAKRAEMEQAKMVLDATAQQLAAGRAELEATGAQLTAAEAEIAAGREALAANEAVLNASEQELAASRKQLDEGWAQYNAGKAELQKQKKEQTAKLNTARNALVQFQQGVDAYNDGVAEVEENEQKLLDGRAEYEDGLKEYEDAEAEFEEKIADAEQELCDARQTLEDLKDPEIFALTRDTNNGYISFEGDSQIVENVAGVFPVFFFLIAALVCSTTMTRMVDDDRAQIGTLRALGYSWAAVMAKYLAYSGSAAVLGSIIGYFGGGYLFPQVIWIAYGMLYSIPGFYAVWDVRLLLASLAVALVCSSGTAYFACRREMRGTPADLIRPKMPEPGKRILLERITPLWRRLKFLHKVSLRNIFRFKKRMVMMIFGIAGCTALVLTGFGLHDSVTNIANYQFDDIQKYDVSVTTADSVDDAFLAELEAEHSGEMDVYAAALMAAGDLRGAQAEKSVYIIASDDPNITEIIDLHLAGETVPYPGSGEILLSEKLARLVGADVGDAVTLSISDTEEAALTVSGIAENYVMNYAYMTGETYGALFGSCEPKTLLLRVAEGEDEYALAAALSNTDGVAAVSVVSDTRRMIGNMMQSLNYVVALVLASAGALAFVVLFNLGNINISERVREIATIKVLGFHARETGAYVFRESFLLSLMGIVFGLPLGILLHQFVMTQIQVDIVSFKLSITPLSYLLTVVMVLLFTFLTDRIMRGKIAKISMAESLKSVE